MEGALRDATAAAGPGGIVSSTVCLADSGTSVVLLRRPTPRDVQPHARPHLLAMAADAAAAEQLQLNTFPETPLRVALFTDVTNGGELLGLLTSGTMEPEVAFINAALVRAEQLRAPAADAQQVASPFALQLAAHKALAASKRTTRTLHSDLVFHLSPTNHVRAGRERVGTRHSLAHRLQSRCAASAWAPPRAPWWWLAWAAARLSSQPPARAWPGRGPPFASWGATRTARRWRRVSRRRRRRRPAVRCRIAC